MPENNPNQQWDPQNGYRTNHDGYEDRMPKNDSARQLAGTANILGITALGTTFILPVVMPMILAPISIILADISRGAKEKFLPQAKRAIIIAVCAIVINIAVAASAVSSAISSVRSPVRRQELDTITRQLYGTTLEEMIRSFDAQYGTDLSSFFGIESENAEEGSEGGSTEEESDTQPAQEDSGTAGTEENQYSTPLPIVRVTGGADHA